MDSYEGKNVEPSSLHKYLYASAAPVTFSDPSGHVKSLPGLAAAGSALATLGTMAQPLIQRAPQLLNTVQRGGAFVSQLASTLLARGQIIVAQGTGLVDKAGQAIGRFKLDLLSRNASANITIAVEGKGVPWFLPRGGAGWQNYLAQLGKQAQAYSQATQSAGQNIQHRVIVFSSRAPQGLEQHWKDVQVAIAGKYDKVFTSLRDFEQWLESL